MVAGSGSVLSGNSVTNARHGFIVSGPATCAPGSCATDLDTNEAEELDGDGYVVTGAGASLTNNDAKGNGGVGYRIGADAASYDTNTAENNDSDGFMITGSNNTFKNNKAENNVARWDSTCPGPATTSTPTPPASTMASRNGMIGPGQIDDGGNKASGTTFSIPPGGGTSSN